MTSAEAAEVPLTDSEWAGLPSTRSNYVTFSQQLPNPLLEGGWMGKGRAEKAEESSGAEVDLNFDVVQMGFMSSYVDAKVFYAEAGLEIRGHWRAADGSVGSVVGTKALAGLALGGLWHLELQTGAESMQHAWNCWRLGHARSAYARLLSTVLFADWMIDSKKTWQVVPPLK
ncbi:Transmembrane protein 65 [Durusdinium trenchii]|uniref:Transmembrane protein 65 n=1 Tax=Durusdinium trenchii TaxID=1381693 RepID=A0ABP0IP75_9DINO